MAVRLVDDFTGADIEPGTGWELKNAKGMTYHVQNLSGLFRVLATEGTKLGFDADRELPKIAGFRVSALPKTNGKGKS